MKKKVLIITHTKDNPCIETVSKAVSRKGGQAIRFNVDRYPLDYCLTTSFNDGVWEVLLKDENDDVHNLTTEFSGLWNRRIYNLGGCLTDLMDEKFVRSCVGEANATLVGMVSHMERELFTLNSYSENKRSGIKEMQLRIAEECGLKIPKTCISNDVEVVMEFIKGCPNGAIAKMQHAFSVYEDGVESVVFTNEVGLDDFDELKEQLHVCPMKFQEKIEKELELRITVVGKKVFAAALNSQVKEKGKIDWRKVGESSIKDWKRCTIPEELEKKILHLHAFCQLNYGAADVILTPQGEYVFLESNPGGEFFWLDEIEDHAISQEIASLLLQEAPATQHSGLFFSDSKKLV